MHLPDLKFLVFPVLTLTIGALLALLSPSPSESDEPPRPAASETEGKALCDILSLRIAAKQRIARGVLADRFSLLEAAALFGALNRQPPQAPDLSLSDGPGSRLGLRKRTDEERLCRQVVDYVGRIIAEDPKQTEAVLKRLEAEFEEELGRQGRIILPEPTSLLPVQKLLAE